jgi:hypothetical protein
MKVLSIDLDYIMEPSIEVYNGIHFDDNASLRWEQLFDNVSFKESHFEINQANLLYCYKTFLKALKNCDSVSFGYEHDSILFSIDGFTNIDLINIDHHDDVFGGDYSLDMPYDEALKKEYYEIVRHDRVHEGNWGAWLMSKDKLNSFTWIGNKNSGNKLRNRYNQELIGNYQNLEREDYVFEDYDFNHIFICLSPQYTPKNHWHYFSMFISAYEQFWEKDAIIHTEKYETHIRHQRLHNEILHQCSDGRGSLSGEGL